MDSKVSGNWILTANPVIIGFVKLKKNTYSIKDHFNLFVYLHKSIHNLPFIYECVVGYPSYRYILDLKILMQYVIS